MGFNSLRGKIPRSLLYLESLKHLDLGNNDISGSLSDFHQSLVSLNLELTQLSDPLPCFSASAQTLSVLKLANNSVVAGIPTRIASITALNHLNLSFNHLTYKIPPRAVSSEKPFVLDLSNNDLAGPLPRKIAVTTEKSRLLVLDLSRNHFSRETPLQILELKFAGVASFTQSSCRGDYSEYRKVDLSPSDCSVTQFVVGSVYNYIVGCFQLLALKLNDNNLSSGIQSKQSSMRWTP